PGCVSLPSVASRNADRLTLEWSRLHQLDVGPEFERLASRLPARLQRCRVVVMRRGSTKCLVVGQLSAHYRLEALQDDVVGLVREVHSALSRASPILRSKDDVRAGS